MKRTLIAAIVSVTLAAALNPIEGQAMFAKMETSDLVASSQLILTGTFEGTRQSAEGRIVGVILVDRVIKGDARDRTRIEIEVPQPGSPVSSSTVLFKAGQQGVWFLQETPSGGLSASHPQRFVDMKQAGPTLEAIAPLIR